VKPCIGPRYLVEEIFQYMDMRKLNENTTYSRSVPHDVNEEETIHVHQK